MVGYAPGLSGCRLGWPCQQPLLGGVRCTLDTRLETGERKFLTLAWHEMTLF